MDRASITNVPHARISPHRGDPVLTLPDDDRTFLAAITGPPDVAARAPRRRRRHRRPGGGGGRRRGWGADHRRRARHRQDGGPRRGRRADPRRSAALPDRPPERASRPRWRWPGRGWPGCSTACSTASAGCLRRAPPPCAPPWRSRAPTSRSSRSPSPWPPVTCWSTPPRMPRWWSSSTICRGSTRPLGGRCRTSPAACSSSGWRSSRRGGPAPTPTPTPDRSSCSRPSTDDVANAILVDAGVTQPDGAPGAGRRRRRDPARAGRGRQPARRGSAVRAGRPPGPAADRPVRPARRRPRPRTVAAGRCWRRCSWRRRSPTATSLRILSALGELGLGVDELETAEANGIVTLDGSGLTFRHPLMRSAAYHDAPRAERRAAHRALAGDAA